MNWKEIKIRIGVCKTTKSDIGYLECSLCDRTFHKQGETYFDLEGENGIITFCEDCLKEIELR